jgi:hypothetical protein
LRIADRGSGLNQITHSPGGGTRTPAKRSEALGLNAAGAPSGLLETLKSTPHAKKLATVIRKNTSRMATTFS